MESHQPNKTTTPFEYFLYAAIIVETGLAAIVYKVVFRSPELARMSAYFAIFYFAFLAWAIAQLSMLHRDRTPKPGQAEPAQIAEREAVPEREPTPVERDIEPKDTHPGLGLTAAQLVIVVVVFATAIATFSWAMRLLR